MKINSKVSVTVKISQEINRGLRDTRNTPIKYTSREGRRLIDRSYPSNSIITIDGVKIF